MNVAGAATALEIQYLLQMLDFLLQFLNVGIIRSVHLVGLDFYHDLLGTVCKLEGGNGLLNVVNNGGNCCDQGGLGVASQRILEKPGDLGITIGDVCGLLALR